MLDVGILGLDSFLSAYNGLELLVGPLGRQLAYAPLETLDLVLGTLADGALGFPIIGPLLS